jgi:hypothetical protein
MAESDSTSDIPTRVCRSCSVQSVTSGDFCPHCGKPYVRRAKSSKIKWVALAVVVILLVAAGATALTVKHHHDVEAKDRRVAAHRKAVAAANAEAAKDARAAAQKAEDASERRTRHTLVKAMQKSITKDAKKDVADGVLDGPILYTTCDPLGGGSTDDLTALTTTFQCLAVDKKNNDGTVSGYQFDATANWSESSYTWHLGS